MNWVIGEKEISIFGKGIRDLFICDTRFTKTRAA